MSIQFKRSSTAGLLPVVSDLKQGELVLNLPDQKIYTLDNNNTVVNIGFSKDTADDTYVQLSGSTMTGRLFGFSTTATYDAELTPKRYVDSLVANSANLTTSTIAGWKTWLPVAGGTMTGRLILNGLTPAYDNEAISKAYVQSTYFPNTGGALTGPIELYSTTPYIDFHYNNSTADYTSRIIAADSTTLQLISGNITLAGTVGVSGALNSSGNIYTPNTVQGGYVVSSGDVHANSSVTAGVNVVATGTVQGGYVVSSGDVHANGNLTGTGVVANGHAANIGLSDNGSTGYGFNSELNTGYFMEKATFTNKSFLQLRNHGVNGISVASDYVNLNLNTYYKGTLLDSLIDSKISTAISAAMKSSSAGLKTISPVQIYSGTPDNGVFTTSISNSIFGNVSPSYVMFTLQFYKTGLTDIRRVSVIASNTDDWSKLVYGSASDDTDQNGTASMYGAATFILPYVSLQSWYVQFTTGSYGCKPNMQINVIGYQY